MLWRDIQLVKKAKVPYHAQHVSTAAGVDMVRQARKEGLPVTCEVTPHHLLLTEQCIQDYDTNYKVNPPLRRNEDIAALKQAIADGVGHGLGGPTHAPHLQSERNSNSWLLPLASPVWNVP